MDGGAVMLGVHLGKYSAFISNIESLEIIPETSTGGYLFKGVLKEKMFSIWGGRAHRKTHK